MSMHADEESDEGVVPMKRSNKEGLSSAETVEGRASPKGNGGQTAAARTLRRDTASNGRCLSSSTMTPFPHPAHRTGQADFPHPALGQDFTPLLSRATPSAVSEHFLELIGCPISMSFTTYCVCLELRSLPSTGITRLHWYYEPLRHPRAPGLSLAGVRLVIADRA